MRSYIFVAFTAFAALAACSAEPPVAPDAVAVEVPVGNPPSANGVTARWTRVRYNATGSVTVSISGNVATLSFSSDFTVDQTPGPFVYLNTTNNPNSGMPLRVGALKSRSGAQTYAFQIPAGVKYTHVLIWCDPFNVAMVEAVIPPTGG